MKNRVVKTLVFGLMCVVLMTGCGKGKETQSDIVDPSQYESENFELPSDETDDFMPEESETVEEPSYEEPSYEEPAEEPSLAPEQGNESSMGGAELVVNDPALENLPTGEEIESAEIREDLEALFASITEAITSDTRTLEPEEQFASTIRYKTEITIDSVTKDKCVLTIVYPYVVDALTEAVGKLDEEPTEGQIRTMYKNLSASLRNNALPYNTVTIELEVVEIEGFWSLKWTKEFYDAVTGGLYSIQ